MKKLLTTALVLIAALAALVWIQNREPPASLPNAEATVVDDPATKEVDPSVLASAPEPERPQRAARPQMTAQEAWSMDRYQALPPDRRLTTAPSVAIQEWMDLQGYPPEDLIEGPESDDALANRALDRCDRKASTALTERWRRRGDDRWLARARENYADSIFHIELLLMEQASRPFASGPEIVSWAATAASLGDPHYLTVVGGLPFRRHIEAMDHQQLLSAVNSGLDYVPNAQHANDSLKAPWMKVACRVESRPRPRLPWDHLANERERDLLPIL